MNIAIAIVCLAMLQGQPRARAELVSGVTTAQAGQSFLAAVAVRTDPGWHVYWVNPGDSGIPTSIKWQAPSGWKVTLLAWPTPRVISSSGMTVYGYEGETLFLARVTPPKSATAGPVSIGAAVKWLVCSEECIPGSAKLKLNLNLGTATSTGDWSARLSDAEKKLPSPMQGWSFSSSTSSSGITLTAKPATGTKVAGTPSFVAEDISVIEPSAPQIVKRNGGGYTIRLRRSQFANGTPARLRGLLLAPVGKSWNGRLDAVVVDVPLHKGGSS